MPPVSSLAGLGWENGNALRNFPLSEAATRLDTTGTFVLPNDLLVDMVLPVPLGSYDPNGFYLSKLAVGGGVVSITLGYDDADAFTCSVNSIPYEFYSVFMRGVGDLSDVIGVATLGSLDSVKAAAGVYAFDQSGGRIAAGAIRPMLRGVRSLRIQTGNNTSSPLTGDIVLAAGRNTQFIVPETDTIRMDAIDGAGSVDPADCGCTDLQGLPPPIRRINGVAGTADGGLSIYGDDCMSVVAAGNSVQINNSCTKPCCTDNDTASMKTAMNTILMDIRALSRQVQTLASQYQSLENLGVRIDATGLSDS